MNPSPNPTAKPLPRPTSSNNPPIPCRISTLAATVANSLIQLATIDARVQGEPGKVFSTGPQVAMGVDGKTYFIKGANSATAFAEVAGCRLASMAGLMAPPAHIGQFGDELYASVESVPGAQRTIEPWLNNRQRIRNRSHLYDVVAVDTWLVNDDRNMGNLVGGNPSTGNIDVFMIDFEKSRTLHPNPFMGSVEVAFNRMWPTADLGRLLRHGRPDRCPAEIVAKIRGFSYQQLDELLQEIANDIPLVTWNTASAEVLHRRAQELDRLVSAVWQAS